MLSAAVFLCFGGKSCDGGEVKPIFASEAEWDSDQLFCDPAVNWCHRGGDAVTVYADVLMLINFLVDLLLLIAANRLSGYPVAMRRAVLAAALGGIYGGVCVIPGFRFLGNTGWRLVCLSLMAVIAFGANRDSVRRSILFILLSMALGGVAVGLDGGGFWSLALSAGAVCVMCLLGFRGRMGDTYVPVEIRTPKDTVRITALRDTGNMLTDPITGQQVLVAGAQVGVRLLGLTAQELKDPIGTMGKVSGLRLLPYHAVGQPGGFLLARRFEDVRIGSWQGSCLVAFAPEDLGKGRPYEALTGGAM